MIPFVKGHGLGNDYLVIDQRALPGPLSVPAITKICDRNHGVGSDGILLFVPSTRADFGLRVFNPGSPTDRRRQPRGTMGLLRVDRGRLASARIVPVT